MAIDKDFLKTPMGKAIKALNKRMKEERLPPVKFNVVGGFALMVAGIRDKNCVTDIDYVGKDLSPMLNQVIKEVGQEYGMPEHWINNDVLLAGSDLEELEYATGTLHFNTALKTDELEINVLEPEDVLRMKLIAIDTSLIAVAEDNADFSRIKDLPDISSLMNHLGKNLDDVMNENEFYITCDYTRNVLEMYETKGLEAADVYAQSIYDDNRKRLSELNAGRRSDEFADLFGDPIPGDDGDYMSNDTGAYGFGSRSGIDLMADEDDEGRYYDS